MVKKGGGADRKPKSGDSTTGEKARHAQDFSNTDNRRSPNDRRGEHRTTPIQTPVSEHLEEQSKG